MPTATKLELNTKEKSVDISSYRGMVGSLLYLTASRPDIMFATCLCARFQADPRESHLVAIKRIFRYLQGTPNLDIWYPRESGFELIGYSDADYAGCKMDMKSTTGTCQFLGNKLMSWFNKKQNSVSTSTAEAEYIAAGSCCAQILWMKNQLLDYGLRVEKIPIFCDNTSAIAITENPVQHSRTKHIDIKYHFIREHVMNGTVELHFVPSEQQLADIFTKPLDESKFSRLVSELVRAFLYSTMAPIVKLMSAGGFIYEKNNSIPFVVKESPNKIFHKMMDFLVNCKLSYAMFHSTPLYNEIIEEIWTSCEYSGTNCTLQFTIQGSSSASQKASVVKSTTQPKGSDSGVVSGEGRGENQRNPKDKVGEVSVAQTSPIVSSQQGTMSNMDISSSLIASSQKDVVIETSSPPRAHIKRVRDTSSPQTAISQYQRRVRQKSQVTQGAHTLEATIPVSQIQFDVAPIFTLGLQSHSLNINIETPPQNSPTQSLDVHMIHSSIPDSPTLFLEKPHSEIGSHHLLSDLLGQQSSFSEATRGSVEPSLKSITTDSTVISLSQTPFLTSSTKQSLSLTSVSPSTEPIPLTVQTTIPLIAHSAPILENQVVHTTSADDLVVVETLLGLKGSESERLTCSQAKGEDESERLAISSSQAKGEIASSTLVGEGEGVRGVSHGEPMMQEKSGEREGTTDTQRKEPVIASELMEVNEGERELTFQEHYQQTLDSISLDPETFTHPVPAYQIMAQQGNVEAERSLNLIHTTASMLRDKDALANLSPGAGGSFEYDGSSSDEDSLDAVLHVATTTQTGTYVVPPKPRWLSQDLLGHQGLDAAITRQYNEAYLAHESAPDTEKKFYKALMDSLEIQRLQMLQTRIEAREIKDSIENLKDSTARRLDEKLPLLTVARMTTFFNKDNEVTTTLKTLTSRVDKVEATLAHMQQAQEKQTQLLTQLVAAQGLPLISLDDNKKGEKSHELNIQVTKVMVPAISLPKEPLAMGEYTKEKLDGVDQIQQASMRLQLAAQIKEQWSSIDARVKKIAETARNKHPSTDQATSTSTDAPIPSSTNVMVLVSTELEPQTKSSYDLKPLLHGVITGPRKEKGQTSCIRDVDPATLQICLSPKSPAKPKGKNIARTFYPPPLPDELKIMSELIIKCKESNVHEIRNQRAIVYRNGQEICVWAGHPNYAEAKAEESARAYMQDLAVAQVLDEEERKQEERARAEAVQGKRKGIRQPKTRAKRNLAFDKDDSQDTFTDAPVTTMPSTFSDQDCGEKLSCDPEHPVNFHDQPIEPKEEPIEFDEANFSKFLVEMESRKKSKQRASKAKPILVRRPQTEKPPPNPEDFIYIADIREESDLNLHLDDLVEVRGIGATHKLPERLVFVYKGGREQIWPLHRILGEDYQTLLVVFKCLKKDFGFTKTAKSEVVSKICQVKASWNKPNALPRTLKVPQTGKKIHLQPYWMMEFRDKDNCRRFFRIEDQLEKASNETLRFMQSKLGDQDEEEKIFYRRLQAQIEENNGKKGKKTRPQRQRW
ncbi:hypothetical protein POM88_025840 [Heracleum sosnowskyi]|uniref:Uncharacterized protein n=1 Tax=Heracleum sosnowskyi TaxID=360622 RepID=A0AAD8MMY0_9APIA|nr:hypothetical protein POM88_025840 [Heracleum sosnowskyi]